MENLQENKCLKMVRTYLVTSNMFVGNAGERETFGPAAGWLFSR